MKTLIAIAVVVGSVYLMGRAGIPQHYMQSKAVRAQVEKDRAYAKAECEKINCWHL